MMIRKLALTLIWLWRIWPAIIIVIIGSFHQALRVHCNFADEHLTPIVALLCQLIGGLLVLYSIDSKIGLFSKNGLKQILKNYLNQFPYKAQTIELSGAIQGSSKITADLEVTWDRPRNTLDEKVEYLQFQVDQLTTELRSNVSRLATEIKENKEVIAEQIDSAEKNIQTVEGSLKAYAVDGLQVQLFGVLLLFYGAINSYIYAA